MQINIMKVKIFKDSDENLWNNYRDENKLMNTIINNISPDMDIVLHNQLACLCKWVGFVGVIASI